ncbi:MAG TPA: dTDP-4-dehydrorhamnose 3,5-epimerase [Candidatus Acidoferrum sp.]|nr:dTDP-4-dehydrorhamnose 3,5-epimerase [Candidatus Acidoferrum sp.]
MQRIDTAIPGVLELRPAVFQDPRGFFIETYHRDRFRSIGIVDEFVQDNHSRSVKNTLRGLHYQLHRGQAKLCRVIEGQAFDVAVDIRVGSPTFGQSVSLTLCAETHNMIYIPAGFAHGFVALTDSVQFLYKCSDFYDSSDEHGIVWNDPALNIPWGVDAPLVSGKDAKLPRLADVARDLLPRYRAS